MIYGDDGCVYGKEYEIKTKIGTLLLQSIIELCKHKKIKDIYETKLNHSFQNNTRLEDQNDKLREMLNIAND